jgi:hypothetical protein
MAESHRNGNYEALAELFFTGECTVPDGMGELIPCAQEAAAIRRCGFDARPGRPFRCPPLPDEVVGGSPLLGHLSDAIDPSSRFATWHPKRGSALGTAHLDPLSKTDKLLLAALERAPGGACKSSTCNGSCGDTFQPNFSIAPSIDSPAKTA